MINIPMPTYYTYLLAWSNNQKYYYGVRYANNAHPDDLFNTYFTSSKYVKKFIKEYGDPDIIQIRKTFNTKESARQWENRVLNRMDVMHDDRSLNMTNNFAFRSEGRTPEHCANLSKSLTGRYSPFTGKTHSDEAKKKNSQKHKGKPSPRKGAVLSDETKQKLSASKKGRPGRKHTVEENKLNSKRAIEYGFNQIVTGTIWVNDGADNKRIKPEQLESYPGFIKGRLV